MASSFRPHSNDGQAKEDIIRRVAGLDVSIGQIGKDIELRLQHLQEKHSEVLAEFATKLNESARKTNALIPLQRFRLNSIVQRSVGTKVRFTGQIMMVLYWKSDDRKGSLVEKPSTGAYPDTPNIL